MVAGSGVPAESQKELGQVFQRRCGLRQRTREEHGPGKEDQSVSDTAYVAFQPAVLKEHPCRRRALMAEFDVDRGGIVGAVQKKMARRRSLRKGLRRAGNRSGRS